MRRMILFSVLATLLWAAPASAAPTVQVAGGHTLVELSPELLGALSDLGVQASAVGPASLRRGIALFPIPAGALDTESYAGDIFHSGGLALSAGTTQVRLLNFVIDTTATPPVLTGLLVANGDLVGRAALFELSLTSLPEVRRSLLSIRGVEVSLTQGAADALNDAFGVEAFEPGFPVGEASVFTRIIEPKKSHSSKRDRDDDSDD